MKFMLFAVYDSQTGLYDLPTSAVNFHDYSRQMSILVNDGKSRFALYKDDLSIWYVGDYETSTSVITPHKESTRLCYLKELVIPPKIDSKQSVLEEIQKLISSLR